MVAIEIEKDFLVPHMWQNLANLQGDAQMLTVEKTICTSAGR